MKNTNKEAVSKTQSGQAKQETFGHSAAQEHQYGKGGKKRENGFAGSEENAKRKEEGDLNITASFDIKASGTCK